MSTQTGASIRMPNVGDPAPDATIQALDGSVVVVAGLWRHAQLGLALVFLRHYGCSFCMEHAREIERRGEEFADAEVTVALVGCGSLDEAADFRDKLGLATAVYNDPESAAYRAYGVGKTTAGTILNPRVVAGGIRAMSKGYLPRRSSGDPLQLQGQFLIDRFGIIRSVSRPRLMSDIPSATALLEDARNLRKP